MLGATQATNIIDNDDIVNDVHIMWKIYVFHKVIYLLDIKEYIIY